MTIVIGGGFGGYISGGQSWAILNYIIGFKKLGHDVFFYEELLDIKNTAGHINFQEYIREIDCMLKKFKLGKIYCIDYRGDVVGISKEKFHTILKRAKLFININGIIQSESIKAKVKKSIFLDIDPGLTQFWCEQYPEYMSRVKNHDLHFTIGKNIGNKDCHVPACGIHWLKTSHFAVLDIWKPKKNKNDAFTTITHWDSGDGVFYKKKYFGYKSVEFMKYINLPKKVKNQAFEFSTYGMDDATSTNFKEKGWFISDSRKYSKNIFTYKKYIEDSYASFSVAKNAYVESKCGWIAEREIAYLASGKPVVLQDTGFSRSFSTGKGLFTFKNMSGAVDAIKEINSNYAYHCKAARKIAEKYFDSDVVLKKLIADCRV